MRFLVMTWLVAALTMGEGAALAADDPAGTRNFTTPSADTIQHDSLRLTNTMLAWTRAEYGLTDRLEMRYESLALVGHGLGFKANLWKNDRVSTAIDASAFVNTVNLYQNALLLRPLVTVADYGVRGTLGAGVGKVSNGSPHKTNKGLLENVFLALDYKATDNLKILGELNFVFDEDSVLRRDEDAWSYGIYGARFFSDTVSVDVGMLVPNDPRLLGKYALGMPMAGFSYRFDTLDDLTRE